MGFSDKEKEYIKCASDPLYFLNNYGYVFDARKQRVERMTCFKYQEECIEKFHEFQNNIILKSRQTGLSVISAGYCAWRLIFRTDQKILIIANDGDGAERFLGTIKQFVIRAPSWMLPDGGTADDPTRTNNQKKIELYNDSWAKARASSENAGRGESLTLLVLDEAAFIEHIVKIGMGAGMALSATQGKCIWLSTPNGTGGLYHKAWIDAEDKRNDFVPTTVHWTQNPNSAIGLEKRRDMNGESVFWSPWYEKECKRLNYDPVLIAQELDLSFEGSKRLAIETDLISKYEKRLLTDEYKKIVSEKRYYDYRQPVGNRFVTYETSFHVFKPPQTGHRYVIGGDVARSDGTDYSTLHVVDIDTLEVVAEYRDKISPDLFAEVIYAVGKDFNYAYLAIEANSFGLATTLDLNRKMGYERMHFCKTIKELHVRTEDYKVNTDETIPGFQTTKKTKPLLVNTLRVYMREGELKIYSQRVLSELRSFIQKGDKSEAENGYNDDLVIALGIALYIRDTDFQNATQTQEMYRSMLDAISYSSGDMEGKSYTANEKVENNQVADGGGLYFGNYIEEEGEILDEEGNDVSWLLTPINPVKTHYFDDPEASPRDELLTLAKRQGYVPKTCLLGGETVMGLVNKGEDPCLGCQCDRIKCKGRLINA